MLKDAELRVRIELTRQYTDLKVASEGAPIAPSWAFFRTFETDSSGSPTISLKRALHYSMRQNVTLPNGSPLAHQRRGWWTVHFGLGHCMKLCLIIDYGCARRMPGEKMTTRRQGG